MEEEEGGRECEVSSPFFSIVLRLQVSSDEGGKRTSSTTSSRYCFSLDR